MCKKILKQVKQVYVGKITDRIHSCYSSKSGNNNCNSYHCTAEGYSGLHLWYIHRLHRFYAVRWICTSQSRQECALSRSQVAILLPRHLRWLPTSSLSALCSTMIQLSQVIGVRRVICRLQNGLNGMVDSECLIA